MTYSNGMVLSDWEVKISHSNTKKMDFRLERLAPIVEKLALTPFPHKVITVAGTNGKGSCVSAMQAILVDQDYKVGATFSPHIERLNERICINGQPLEDDEICAALEQVEQARGEINLTYFEYTILAFLYYFKHAALDVVLLEVGLGGRLDMTNLIDADVAVITSVGLDHTEILGPDRESIGFEKAGITRSGKPLVYGEETIPNSVLTLCKEKKVPIYQLHKDFEPEPIDCNLKPSNIACAIQALKLLPGIELDSAKVRQTLQGLQVPGRFEVLSGVTNLIYDVAHNPAAITYLFQQLVKQPCKGKTLAVFAIQKHKDVSGSLLAIKEVIDEWFIAPLCDVEAVSCEVIKAHLSETEVVCCDSVADAVHQAYRLAKPGDRVVVFGSFYTVSEAKRTNP